MYRIESEYVFKTVKDIATYKIFRIADGGSSWSPSGEIACDSLGSYAYIGDGRFLFLDTAGNLYEMSEQAPVNVSLRKSVNVGFGLSGFNPLPTRTYANR